MSGNDYLGYMNNYYLQGNSNNRFLGYTLGGYPSNLNVDYNIPKYEYKPIVGSAFNYSSLYSQPTSGTSSSTNDWRASIEAENRARIERKQQAQEQQAEALADTIFITTSQREAMKEHEEDKKKKENIIAEGGLLGTLGFAGLFTCRSINRARKVKQNAPVNELLFKYDVKTGKAVHANLFKDAPIVMQEAQVEMVKARQSYLKELKKLQKSGAKTHQLTKDFDHLQKILNDALKTGDPQKVAEATERIKTANGTKYRKIRGTKNTKLKIAHGADITKVKAIKGNKLINHMGGKFGIAMSVITPIIILLTDKDRIKNAFQDGTGTGLKQLGLSLLKGVASAGTYLLAEGFARKAVASAISKGAGKIAAKMAGKLVAKGAGKILGTVLGSFIPVPGLNLILGALIGSAIDLGIRKLTANIKNPGDNVEIDKTSSKKLLAKAYIDKKNGVELDTEIETALRNNPNFCAMIEQELVEEQKQLAQQQGENATA